MKIYIFTLLVVFSFFGCATNGMATRDIALSNQLAIEKQERETKKLGEELIMLIKINNARLEDENKRLWKKICKKHPEDCPPSVLER